MRTNHLQVQNSQKYVKDISNIQYLIYEVCKGAQGFLGDSIVEFPDKAFL